MAKFPCSSPASLCDQSPNPITTYSSEAIDGPTFIGIAWSQVKPLLGKVFTVYPCEAICESQVSQLDANQCAARNVVGCADTCAPLFNSTTQSASLNCADGTPYSFSVSAGQFTALSQLEADRLAFQFAAQFLQLHSICMSGLAPLSICLEDFYVGQIVLSGTDAPFSAAVIAGSLPPGVVMDVQSGQISFSGQPTQAGVFTFTIEATNSASIVTQKTFTVAVGQIITDSPLPDGTPGTDYSVQFQAFTNPDFSVTWQVTDGTLPDGLALDPDTGVLSGNPTTPGDSDFTVSVTNGPATCSKEFAMTVISSSNVCDDGLGDLGNNCYAISGYFDGLVPNTSANPPGDTVYDGTFKFFDPDQGDQGFWFGADVTDTNLAMVGQFLCNVQLQFRGCTDEIPLWRIQFDINSDDWRGEKGEGNTPEGVYTKVAGSAPGPATLTIVKIAGVTTVPGNTTCSS
jgi:hypothetical protein